MSDECGHQKLLANINNPDPTHPGNVFAPDMPGMPPALTGILCQASGVVSPPPGFFVATIFAKNFNTGVTVTKELIQNSPEFTKNGMPPGGDLPWTATNSFRAANRSAATPSPYVANNQLGITALFMSLDMSQSQWMPVVVTAYKGDAVTQCPASLIADGNEDGGEAENERHCKGAKHAVQAFADPGPTIVNGCRDCQTHACGHCNHDWFHFDGLSVSNQNGNLLLAETQALRASTIAVYARRVCWKAKPTSQDIIRRPHRLSRLEPEPVFGFLPLMFPDLPPHSILLYQPTSGIVHLVTSQSPDHPDIVSLDPNYDVFAIVNDRIFGCYPDNVGSFSLSIAILGEGKGGGCGCG